MITNTAVLFNASIIRDVCYVTILRKLFSYIFEVYFTAVVFDAPHLKTHYA
jgi:hypothetical protein